MSLKSSAKEKLISYLIDNENRDISRIEIIENTGISKSRLSELINELRLDGYNILTPNRSGLIRFHSSSNLISTLSLKHSRQWLILLALSKVEKATYQEIIFSLLAIIEPNYLYEKMYTDENYTDANIYQYLEKNNTGLINDILQLLPLHTLRKDLQELSEEGYVEKKRMEHNNKMHFVYYLSEKSPRILFESEDAIYEFINYYESLYTSQSNANPLESLYRKTCNIYDWTGDPNKTSSFGKANRITSEIIKSLNSFIEYPYKTKVLSLSYETNNGIIDIRIKTGLIFYSDETNCFYALCYNLTNEMIMQLRLDRILTVKIDSEDNNFYRSNEILTIYEEMFSASYDATSMHVKILFQNFGNVIERISSLHTKRKKSKLYELSTLYDGIPHSYVYEDDLRGISSFARFLRSFGSSALVISPPELQKLMIDSNQRILDNYKEKVL